MKFPIDAPKRKVIKAFEVLGFKIVRAGNHILTFRVSWVTKFEIVEKSIQ
jgi:hypothetical protein